MQDVMKGVTQLSSVLDMGYSSLMILNQSKEDSLLIME